MLKSIHRRHFYSAVFFFINFWRLFWRLLLLLTCGGYSWRIFLGGYLLAVIFPHISDNYFSRLCLAILFWRLVVAVILELISGSYCLVIILWWLFVVVIFSSYFWRLFLAVIFSDCLSKRISDTPKRLISHIFKL